MGKENEKRILVFRDGTTKTITDENGKYWICGKTQFRKSNPDIVEVKTEKAEEKKEPAKKKKETKKKDKEFEQGFDVMPDVSDILAEEFKD